MTTLKTTKTVNAGDGILQLSSVLILFVANTETVFYDQECETTMIDKSNIYNQVKNKISKRHGRTCST